MWNQGFFDAKTQTLHIENLQNFEKQVGKHFSIAHYYRGWEALEKPILREEFSKIRQQGWQPMINMNPYYFDKCPASKVPLYRAIADGQCDDFLRRAGKNLSQINEPFYLLFAWEMNNHELEWSVSRTGSKPQDYIDAWRHMHDIFEEEGATNIIWVFCPNVPERPDLTYASVYPGDNYVDWLGMDGYNWGTTQTWSSWTDFSGVFSDAYTKLHTIAPEKPIMISEVNTTDRGGDKAKWYTDMLATQIPYNFPAVKAVVFFNEDRSTTPEKINWKIDVNKNSLEAFKKSIQLDYYQ